MVFHLKKDKSVHMSIHHMTKKMKRQRHLLEKVTSKT